MARRKAVRLFVLGDNDELIRFPAARYKRMVRQPSQHPVVSLANRRVRFAEVLVELRSRKAVRVLRMLFWNATFDERGALDTGALGRQSVAALDTLLQELLPREQPLKVVDAAARFVAGGGTWVPTPRQRADISDAALGQSNCVTLRH